MRTTIGVNGRLDVAFSGAGRIVSRARFSRC